MSTIFCACCENVPRPGCRHSLCFSSSCSGLACLSSQPVWIGWRVDLLTSTVRMESARQQRLLLLLQQVLEARHVPRHDVEKLTGKLLWLSGLVSFLRPTLAPLYALQHAGQAVMAAFTPDQWSSLRSLLDADLFVRGSIGHPSVPVGSRLLRLACCFPACLTFLLGC